MKPTAWSLSGYEELVAAILRDARSDPNYYREPCGQWWCWLGGLDPAIVWDKAVRGTQREGLPYVPLTRCYTASANSGQHRAGESPMALHPQEASP